MANPERKTVHQYMNSNKHFFLAVTTENKFTVAKPV